MCGQHPLPPVEGLLGFIQSDRPTDVGTSNTIPRSKIQSAWKNKLFDRDEAETHSKRKDEKDRLLRWQVAGEIRVWLCRAYSRGWPTEYKPSRWIFAGVESHQSFRSVANFALGEAKDRLDDYGRILSAACAWFFPALN